MIRCFDYLASLPEIEDEIHQAFCRVLHSGRLILGPETEAFEAEFAAFVGARHAVAVTSGTTALHLALAALGVGPGDEVVTVSNTCAPTVAAIRLTGAEPVFVDVREDSLMMDVDAVEPLVTERTRCILPVHLWGSAVDLDRLGHLCHRHGLHFVEDCAQAQGTTWRGRAVGTFGAAGCFSFYPTKNIGAFGDAGAVVTDDDDLATRLRRLRMYGYDSSPVSQVEGTNGRISEMQAAFLRIKLKVYPDWLERRLAAVAVYDRAIRSPEIGRPEIPKPCVASYHQYVVRLALRDALAEHLRAQGIDTGIHYPTPVHRMPAYRNRPGARRELPVTESACQEILSLPIHESLAQAEAGEVAAQVERFARRAGAGT